MSIIETQVRRARLRLNLNAFLEASTRGIVAAALVLALTLVTWRALAADAPTVAVVAAAAGFGALVTAYVWFRARVGALAAAVAIDQAAGLKERVSTALVVSLAADPFAQAAAHDAERAVAAVDLRSKIPVRSPRLLHWSGACVVSAVLLYLLMPNLNLLAALRPEPEDPQKDLARVERDAAKVALREHRDAAIRRLEDKPHLKELAEDLKLLDLPDKPSDKPEDVRRDVLSQLQNVQDKLQERLDSQPLRGLDDLKKQLAKLEQPGDKQAASELTKALSNGDFSAAKKSLQDLKDKLEEAARKGDPAAKQQLAEVQQKLEVLAKRLEKLADATRMQKELENKAGLTPEQARKLAEALSKMDPKQMEKALQQALGDKKLSDEQMQQLLKNLASQKELMQQCQKLAQCMAKSAAACQKARDAASGDAAAQMLADGMEGAMGAMSDLEMAEQMAGELQAQLNDLRKLAESNCQGGLCPGPPGDSDKIGQQGPQYGLGRGSRIGKQPVAHQYDPTQVKGKNVGGEIIGQMLLDGPQVKGEAAAAAQAAIDAAVRDASDAMEREEVPARYRNVAQRYFESLAGLLRGAKPAEAPTADDESPAADDESPDAVEGGADEPAKQP